MKKALLVLLSVVLIFLCGCTPNEEIIEPPAPSNVRTASGFFIQEIPHALVSEYEVCYRNFDGTVETVVNMGIHEQPLTIIGERIYFCDDNYDIVSIDFNGETPVTLSVPGENLSRIIYHDKQWLYCTSTYSDNFIKIDFNLTSWEEVPALPFESKTIDLGTLIHDIHEKARATDDIVYIKSARILTDVNYSIEKVLIEAQAYKETKNNEYVWNEGTILINNGDYGLSVEYNVTGETQTASQPEKMPTLESFLDFALTAAGEKIIAADETTDRFLMIYNDTANSADIYNSLNSAPSDAIYLYFDGKTIKNIERPANLDIQSCLVIIASDKENVQGRPAVVLFDI